MGIIEDVLDLPPAARRAWMWEQEPDDLTGVFGDCLDTYGTSFLFWQGDPVGFVEDVCEEHVWSKQAEIMQTVVSSDERRVAVPSCHGAGKSHTAGRLIAYHMSVYPPGTAKAISTAPTFRQVRNVLWPHVHRVHKKAGLPGRLNQIEWVIDGEPLAYGFSPAKNDESAAQGVHADHVLIVVDEAGGIPEKLGKSLLGNMTGDARILAIGNPATDIEGSWFETICEGSGLWQTIRIPVDETPNFTGEIVPPEIAGNLVDPRWVAEILEEYGEDDPFYIARVLALFPKTASRRVIPPDWLDRVVLKAADGDPREEDEDFRGVDGKRLSNWQRLGVDVASDGGDEMVVAHADGWECRIPDECTWSGAQAGDQVKNAERVVEQIHICEAIQRRRGFHQRRVRVKVDGIGIGDGTADILAAMGKDGKHNADIVKVKVSQKANRPDKFVNRRAEMWWHGRELVRSQTIRLRIAQKEVKQLSVPTFSTGNAGGKTSVETKAELRRRGIHSPDRADAILMAFYEPEGVAPQTNAGASTLAGRSVPTKPGQATRLGQAGGIGALARMAGPGGRVGPRHG